mgnify:CR=1 FL=1
MFEGYLPHYANLLRSEDVAYYLLCKDVDLDWSDDADLEDLWKTHTRGETLFKEKLDSISSPREILKNVKPKSAERTFLGLKNEIVNRLLKDCIFCENRCRSDRTKTTGKCGITEVSHVNSAFLHRGEESPLVPSGTIFFTGCTFDCVFCQNWDISMVGKGKYKEKKRLRPYGSKRSGNPVSPADLANYADRLEERGARNINYVGGDPTPNLHTIIASMKYQQNNICQLWNSNFYNTTESLRLLREVMDFWLPDFKYGNNDCGKRYSGIKNYWDVITRNFNYIYDWGSREIIIRHLVMPGHYECCTKPILEWIAKNIPEAVVNIMGQYRPEHLVNRSNYSEINRRVTRNEMAQAYALAEALHIEYKLVS